MKRFLTNTLGLLSMILILGFFSACQLLPSTITQPLDRILGKSEPRPTVEVVEIATSQAFESIPTSTSPVVTPTPYNETPLLGEQDILISLYQNVNPSVVNVNALQKSLENLLIGFSQGSGFVFDANGNIVTNAHVIQEADAIEVTFYNNITRPATLVGEDFSSDLAVIKVDQLPEGIIPLPLGDERQLKVGETVIAIGNPFGFEGTMTRGIVSAIGRTIPSLTTFRIPRAIQTDAAINPGNSGGPLLNLKGEVVGVNAQITTDGESRSNSGVAFAIPVSLVKRVVPALIASGSYDWPWLGVTGYDLDWATAHAMNLPVERGAYLSSITEGGPSAKAGLRGSVDSDIYENRYVEIGGDVVIKINDQPIYTFDDLLIYIALNTEPGQVVTLTILRDGVEKEVSVTLGKRPAELITPQFQLNPTPLTP